jgi:predicted peroxiredoxin
MSRVTRLHPGNNPIRNSFMRHVKYLGLLFTLLTALLSQSVVLASDGQKLFVNLSSDNIDRAAMAIGFSTKVLQHQKMPVTLFLNVEGVRLANKHMPQHQHASGKTIQQMLADFMAAGGKVIVCPMCMKHVGGIGADDLIEGAQVGGPDITMPALFAPNTTVLSY